MMDLGLKDMIHNKYDPSPKTCKGSKNSPIDCIFGSATLRMGKGGFISFHRLCSNYRVIWVDIPTDMMFGCKPP